MRGKPRESQRPGFAFLLPGQSWATNLQISCVYGEKKKRQRLQTPLVTLWSQVRDSASSLRCLSFLGLSLCWVWGTVLSTWQTCPVTPRRLRVSCRFKQCTQCHLDCRWQSRTCGGLNNGFSYLIIVRNMIPDHTLKRKTFFSDQHLPTVL